MIKALQKLADQFVRTLNIYLHCGFIGKGRLLIEGCSLCQLRCPVCLDIWQIREGVGRGYLSFANFKKFVDRYPWFNEIELSNNGEIFLNPDLEQIMEYACQKGIALTATNGVNFNNVKDPVLEALVKYRFKAMSISMDGASQETYATYRVGGHFDRVIEHIRKVNEFKKKYQTNTPHLNWQFIVFGHNEHELPKAREMAEKLGMTFTIRENANPEFSPAKTDVKAVTAKAEDEKGKKERVVGACTQFFSTPQINWNGDLLGCCYNTGGIEYGNVFDKGLKECIRGEKYQYALKMLKGKKPPGEDIACNHCYYYQQMRQTGDYITEYNFLSWIRRMLKFRF